MRPAACLMQVPTIATLVNTEGHVLFQNEASLDYWGALVVPQGTTATAAPFKRGLRAGEEHTTFRCVENAPIRLQLGVGMCAPCTLGTLSALAVMMQSSTELCTATHSKGKPRALGYLA